MAILTGDIKLVASQVMDDVLEGGGAPTSTIVQDGVSNAIFPDISELDRAGGRVNLRKLHVSVQTNDTDTYMGSNIIVSEPPEDPNVSVTLFTTNSTFDRRDAASSRIESYLNKGPVWGGMLLEDHITGQGSIQILQARNSQTPAIGQTLVLIQNEKLTNEYSQYVRTTAVSYVERTYYDPQGKPVICWVVTCALSDALRYDFTGSPGTYDIKPIAAACKVRDTVVADAGVYVGVTPLTSAATLGSFTVNAKSVYTQLVPSAQTESPITDVRTNGLSSALVPTGGAVTQSISMGFTTSANLFVGGPIYPGTLSIVRSGVTATDKAGRLMSAAIEVGQVDYDNGIVSLSTNVWGATAGTHSVTFVPAAVPDLISDQRAIRVTVESRSMNYTFVMDDIPVARTMVVSYLAQGRWYVLRDGGDGVLSGISSAYGIGTVNYSTGSVSITLGALPDVGSAIVIQSFSKVTTVAATNTTMTNAGKAFVPMNTNGAVSVDRGAKSIAIGSLAIGWMNGTAKVVHDDGFGNLTGDGTGTVDYTQGVVRLSPNALPAPGTVFLMDINGSRGDVVNDVPIANGNLGVVNINPGSVSFSLSVTVNYSQTASPVWRLSFESRFMNVLVIDDGHGVLKFKDPGNSLWVSCGTIDYATGAINVNPTPVVTTGDVQGPMLSYQSPYGTYCYPWNSWTHQVRTINANDLTVSVVYSSAMPGSDSISVTVNQYWAQVLMVPNYTLKGAMFTLGSDRYLQLTDNTLIQNPSPTTGGGTPAGSVVPALGIVNISRWTTGVAPTLIDWRGLIAPPSSGVEAPFTTFSTIFRTASSPLRPSSVSVLGTMQDGTSFNVTANADGKFNSDRVKGRVDYQYGLVELYFVNPNGDAAYNRDYSFLNIPGLATAPADLVMLASLRYNAVAFSYLPLDAKLLGIDPVRLPSDGRVPIFRSGGFAVVGHTGSITATVTNGQVIDCARVRLSRVRVLGHDGNVINTGYTPDLETGHVTFTDVTGYSQPITLEHRIEDMAVVREAQLSGEITFTRPITHDYPIGSFVSSALVAGDLKARVSVLFDQATWNGTTWQDTVSGSNATGTFNDVLAPIVVTNKGTLTERWALVFTSSTAFNIIGEHVGVIGIGNINSNAAPTNPATNVPYFTVPALGWGLGWAVGNIVRFNTIGAMAPVWVVRTVQQGPNTGVQHSFTLLSRGDVDRP